jgi:drug/metabolite transporter (DMT)-like permease
MSAKNTIFPLIALLIATILYAIGPATVKLLVEQGGSYGLKNPGAISFCNVLFIGNMCAGLITLVFYGAKSIYTELIKLKPKVKFYLLISATLSAIYPSLLFIALEYTSVINLVLISRFNGIVYVILAFLFIGNRIKLLDAVGYSLIAIAVLVLLIIQNKGFYFGKGDLLILSAALFFALTEIVSKKVIPECSIGAYVFFRNFFSSILFFIFVIYLFGLSHFMEAFEGELWVLMLVYAGIAIVLAQIFWLTAIKSVPIHYVANIKLFDPVFTLTFAYFLLNEVPNTSEWIVMGIIFVGILMPKLGRKKQDVDIMQTTSIDRGLVGR